MFTFTLHNEHDTDRLGAALAEVLPPGTVVALIGTLGAGKTRLVQAVAVALGVPREAVTSPTFVLVNEYRQGRVPIFHFDTYRLKDDDEFLALGPEEYFDSNGITFVEWADRVADLLPADRVEITIEVTDDTTRQVAISQTGSMFSGSIEALRQLLAADEP
jgi:tRNA threonylcarbamoyladenosine biosynthesis protein TsaE